MKNIIKIRTQVHHLSPEELRTRNNLMNRLSVAKAEYNQAKSAERIAFRRFVDGEIPREDWILTTQHCKEKASECCKAFYNLTH